MLKRCEKMFPTLTIWYCCAYFWWILFYSCETRELLLLGCPYVCLSIFLSVQWDLPCCSSRHRSASHTASASYSPQATAGPVRVQCCKHFWTLSKYGQSFFSFQTISRPDMRTRLFQPEGPRLAGIPRSHCSRTQTHIHVRCNLRRLHWANQRVWWHWAFTTNEVNVSFFGPQWHGGLDVDKSPCSF